MASMTGQTLLATYKGLLKTKGDNVAIPTGSTGIQIVDGEENVTPLYLTDGEVGIGTATPGFLLDVESSGDGYKGVFGNTTQSIKMYVASGGNIVDSGTTADLSLGVDGTRHLTVVNSGNVGIGTTSPGLPLTIVRDNADTYKQGDIAGYTYSTTSSTFTALRLGKSNSMTEAHAVTDDDDVLGAVIYEGNNGSAFKSAAMIQCLQDGARSGDNIPAELLFRVNSGSGMTTPMVILPGGKVGIGTTAPEKPLEVVSATSNSIVRIKATGTGGEASSATSGGVLQLIEDDGAAMADTHCMGTIVFYGAEDASGTLTQAGSIKCIADETWSASENGAALTFSLNHGNDAGPTEYMRIDDGGNVGIGTATPLNPLHIESTIDAKLRLSFDTGDYMTMAVGSSGQTTITTVHDGGAAGHIALMPDGNVGIGTASPDTTLEVVGSFAANGPSSTFVTMSSGDTSPDVSTGNIFKSHGDGVTIDQFDGGICGQIITIISGGATVYDVTSSELNGGTTNITTAAGDVTMWVCESATDWHLLSWMDLSIDLSSGGF